MSLTYTTWKETIANLLIVDQTETEFVQILPEMIDYAEQRIYREIDLLSTVTRDTGVLTVGTRSFTLPSNNGRFVVTNALNVITPAATTDPDLGTRKQLVPVSLDYLNATSTSPTASGVPSVYAMLTDQIVNVDFPDAAYTIEVIGTIRPTPLSEANPTTFLTLYLPDVFVAASMVFGTGFQKNWGAQADDPQMATSWESQYGKLFASANLEEQRKRYASGAWGSLSPTPAATPTR